jgi:hypothetical protein
LRIIKIFKYCFTIEYFSMKLMSLLIWNIFIFLLEKLFQDYLQNIIFFRDIHFSNLIWSDINFIQFSSIFNYLYNIENYFSKFNRLLICWYNHKYNFIDSKRSIIHWNSFPEFSLFRMTRNIENLEFHEK